MKKLVSKTQKMIRRVSPMLFMAFGSMSMIHAVAIEPLMMYFGIGVVTLLILGTIGYKK